jgi:hypothetical protein
VTLRIHCVLGQITYSYWKVLETVVDIVADAAFVVVVVVGLF